MAIINDDEERQGLAAEYVLGTLSDQEKLDIERRLPHDQALSEAITAWEKRLAPLLEGSPSQMPSRDLLPSILDQLDDAPITTQRPAKEYADRRTNVIQLKKQVSFWRGASITAAALAASLAMFIVFDFQNALQRDKFIAVLQTNDREPAFVVSINIRKGEMQLVRLGPQSANDKSYELWAVGGGRKQPASLGVVNDKTKISLANLTPDKNTDPQAITLAISLEPKGGSPTGVATGPILYTGKILPSAD